MEKSNCKGEVSIKTRKKRVMSLHYDGFKVMIHPLAYFQNHLNQKEIRWLKMGLLYLAQAQPVRNSHYRPVQTS